MIVRFVKMTFKEEQVGRFLELFETWRPQIEGSSGCLHLELLQDVHDRRIFFTHSHWSTPADLEKYRLSEVFRTVWPTVKQLFDGPAEAWSLEKKQ